jgi:hypothetical protein
MTRMLPAFDGFIVQYQRGIVQVLNSLLAMYEK